MVHYHQARPHKASTSGALILAQPSSHCLWSARSSAMIGSEVYSVSAAGPPDRVDGDGFTPHEGPSRRPAVRVTFEALDRDAVAGRAFDALSYSARQRFVISIEAARTADTRERRIAEAVSELRQDA